MAQAQKCPYDGERMTLLQGTQLTEKLMGVLSVDTNSMAYNMIKGSARPSPNGNGQECPKCGHLAIFTR